MVSTRGGPTRPVASSWLKEEAPRIRKKSNDYGTGPSLEQCVFSLSLGTRYLLRARRFGIYVVCHEQVSQAMWPRLLEIKKVAILASKCSL